MTKRIIPAPSVDLDEDDFVEHVTGTDDVFDDEDNEEPDPSCVYCQCDERHACVTPVGPCFWFSTEPRVCSATDCIAAFLASTPEVAGSSPAVAGDSDVAQLDRAPGPQSEERASDGDAPAERSLGELRDIPIGQLTPDPDQPREDADEELAGSILANGVLNPITVRRLYDEDHVVGFMIVDGERRYRGALNARLATMPARIVDDNDDEGDRLLRQVLSNDGKRLTPMEEARSWKRIMTAKGWTAQQLAKALGRGKSTVSDRLALLDAPEAFHKYLVDGTLSTSTAPILRQFAGVPADVAAEMIRYASEGDDWIRAVEEGKPVPLDVVKQELDEAVKQLQFDRSIGSDADFPGQTFTIRGFTYAVDPKELRAFRDARNAREAAAAPKSSAPKAVVNQVVPGYVLEERERQKKAHATSDARADIARGLRGKLPTDLMKKEWALFLVRHLLAEMTTDSQRFAVKILMLNPPKMGTNGFQFDKAIMTHAETLGAPQLVQLALTLLLAPDLYVSPHNTSNEAPKRITEAAKLLKFDTKSYAKKVVEQQKGASEIVKKVKAMSTAARAKRHVKVAKKLPTKSTAKKRR